MPASTQSKSPESLIRAARDRSNRAIAERNLITFADSLDKDFVAIVGDSSFIPSREEYVALLKHNFADPKTTITYTRITDAVDVSAAKPLAAEHGHWIGTFADGAQAYTGTYMAVWRRGPSGWKIRSELFVTLTCNEPIPCATPPYGTATP